MNKQLKHGLVAVAAAFAMAGGMAGAPAQADTVTSNTCALPGSGAATLTNTPYILNYDEWQASYSGTTVASLVAPSETYVLLGPALYGGSDLSTVTTAGANPVAYFQSYADFFSAATGTAVTESGDLNTGNVVAAIPSGIHWVELDMENWSNAPGTAGTVSGTTNSGGSGEIGDATAAIAGFIQLAHELGYQVIASPSPDLTGTHSTSLANANTAISEELADNWAQETNPVSATTGADVAPWPNESASGDTLSAVSSAADIYSIQAQTFEDNGQGSPALPLFDSTDYPGTTQNYFQYFTQQNAQEALTAANAAGTSLVIFSGLGADHAPTSAAMYADAEAAAALENSAGTAKLISGFWLNIEGTPPVSANVQLAEGYLNDVTETSNCTLAFNVAGYSGAPSASLSGGATTTACSICSSGYRIKSLGTATFSSVAVPSAGYYTMTVFYTSVGSSTDQLKVATSTSSGACQSQNITSLPYVSSGVLGIYTVSVDLCGTSANTVTLSGTGSGTTASVAGFSV